jgi:hypothetical protein
MDNINLPFACSCDTWGKEECERELAQSIERLKSNREDVMDAFVWYFTDDNRNVSFASDQWFLVTVSTRDRNVSVSCDKVLYGLSRIYLYLNPIKE